jgi:3-deoxy-7-phosphoheptulonate synthase
MLYDVDRPVAEKGCVDMIIVMKANATEEQIAEVVGRVKRAGFGVHLSQGATKTIIGAIGGDRVALDQLNLEALAGVEKVAAITKPYKLAGREFHPHDTVVTLPNGVAIGGGNLAIIAGPCSVEGHDAIIEAAEMVKALGAHALRAGAFKPRSSPYSFQGFADEGLKMLAAARGRTGLPVVTEVMDTRQVELVAQYADVLQIGTRNAQNFSLLKEVGKCDKPVLLKRGMSMTIEEWLMAAEYILSAGNPNVILCERGIRTFETATRNTLDLSAVVVAKSLTHLPVVVDPSHGTGKRAYVVAMARAAVAAGADGLLVEVHPRPDEAASDAAQTIGPAAFDSLVRECAAVAAVLGRNLPLVASAHAD